MTGGNKTKFLIKIQSYYFPACGTETKQHLSVCQLPLTFEQKCSDSSCLCFHRQWAVAQTLCCKCGEADVSPQRFRFCSHLNPKVV